jgi:peptide/nickel transport system substrate-binding protein
MALVIAMLLVGCAAPASPPPSSAPAPAEAPRPAPPKNLVIGIVDEPEDMLGLNGSRGGFKHVAPMAHDRLVYQDDVGDLHPMLATEVISVEKGTWRANADGSMDTIWKLRPGIKWQDGTPFTSADLLFTFNVRKDPAAGILLQESGRLELMESASAPDPLTFVVHWTSLYAQASLGDGLPALPKHLLESTYENNKANFINDPRLLDEFVGLGPYRLAKWERGSFMEFKRFDDYYRGRPPFDTVTVRFRLDPNTQVANLLSGAVDVLLPEGISLDAALEVKRRWEGTGNEVRFDLRPSVRMVDVQLKPEVARPANGFVDKTVRHAFYHAIDRQALAEGLTSGLAPVADSWITPNESVRAALQPYIPQYPYDPTRAQQLLASVGWVRGSDGLLVHTPTGERFETEIQTPASAEAEKEMAIIADYWKAIGAQPTLYARPRSVTDLEAVAKFPGALMNGPRAVQISWGQYYHSRNIAAPANRWASPNRPGYSNTRVDALLDQLATTLDSRQQIPVHGQLLQELMGDAPIMPLYWQMDALLAVKGVKSNRTAGNIATWNFFTWDRT